MLFFLTKSASTVLVDALLGKYCCIFSHMKQIPMSFSSLFWYMKQIRLPFCSLFSYKKQIPMLFLLLNLLVDPFFNEKRVNRFGWRAFWQILLSILAYEADSDVFLLLILLYETDSATILLLILLWETDSDAFFAPEPAGWPIFSTTSASTVALFGKYCCLFWHMKQIPMSFCC